MRWFQCPFRFKFQRFHQTDTSLRNFSYYQKCVVRGLTLRRPIGVVNTLRRLLNKVGCTPLTNRLGSQCCYFQLRHATLEAILFVMKQSLLLVSSKGDIMEPAFFSFGVDQIEWSFVPEWNIGILEKCHTWKGVGHSCNGLSRPMRQVEPNRLYGRSRRLVCPSPSSSTNERHPHIHAR